jgi:hypothetical protein
MGSFSLVHWLILLLYIIVIGVPTAKIIGRLGYSKAWTILAFLPLVNVVALWVLASAKWPNLAKES